MVTQPAPVDPRLRRARGLALSLGIAAVLFAILAALGWRDRATPNDVSGLAALTDEGVRDEVIRRLVADSQGIFDSHPDPDVGRVLQAGLEERPIGSITVTTNSFGMRDREWELPKPAGRVRVVALGDSFVFGNGVADPNGRLGPQLERALREHAATPGLDVEVLSLGVASWNIKNECAYLRRQLTLLEPDLVVHVVVNNDLDDSMGVRGFGAFGRFAPAHRGRADGILTTATPWELGHRGLSLLIAGLDHESSRRYAEASADMIALADAVEARGASYLAVVHWTDAMPIAGEHLARPLGERRVAYVSDWIHDQAEYIVSPADRHWSPAGAELVSRMVFGVVRERGLLKGVELEAWPLAEEAVAKLHEAGRTEAYRAPASAPILTDDDGATRGESARIDLADLDSASAAQIYGGITKDGFVAPFACVMLRNDGARGLRVRGAMLARPELAGTVRVYLDEREVLALPQSRRGAFDETAEIPAELLERTHLSVRFVSDDYGYSGPALDRCAALRLGTIELIP